MAFWGRCFPGWRSLNRSGLKWNNTRHRPLGVCYHISPRWGWDFSLGRRGLQRTASLPFLDMSLLACREGSKRLNHQAIFVMLNLGIVKSCLTKT